MFHTNGTILMAMGLLIMLGLCGRPALAATFVLFPGTSSQSIVFCVEEECRFTNVSIPNIPGAEFSGGIRVTSEKNRATIIITGGIITNVRNTVTAGEVNFVSVGYNFDPGDGVLSTNFDLILDSPSVVDPIKSVSTRASASSFNNNPATANWAAPFTVGDSIDQLAISPNMEGMPVRNGRYSGAGTLTATLIITGLDPNSSITFPDSAVFEAAVPEPATVVLLGTGLAGVAVKLRKRLKTRNGGEGRQ